MSLSKFKSYVNHCWRVLQITKKPDKVEYITVVKASGLGIAVIGMIGFLLQMFHILLF
ncbi:protein translocase SEC61 complex subunit gamma [Bacteroidota bacterium]